MTALSRQLVAGNLNLIIVGNRDILLPDVLNQENDENPAQSICVAVNNCETARDLMSLNIDGNQIIEIILYELTTIEVQNAIKELMEHRSINGRRYTELRSVVINLEREQPGTVHRAAELNRLAPAIRLNYTYNREV